MRPAPRTAFVSKSRDFAMGAVDARNMWRLYLQKARDQADLAIKERWPFVDDARAFDQLIHRLQAPFPIRRHPFAELGTVALRLGRILTAIRLQGEVRESVARLLLAAVEVLEQAFREEEEAATELARRIAGEPED